MGGSGIGGAARARRARRRALAPDRRRRAATRCRPWATPDTLVLCSSYSGDTEETLAAYDARRRARRPADRRDHRRRAGRARAPRRRAGDPAARRLPAARRGRLHARGRARGRPRSCGAAPSLRAEIEVAAAHAEGLAREWGPDGPRTARAKALARRLHGTVPVIAGAGLTAPVAYRWKTQINENAKLPAFARRAARARPQRDRRLGRRASRAASPRSSSRTPSAPARRARASS